MSYLYSFFGAVGKIRGFRPLFCPGASMRTGPQTNTKTHHKMRTLINYANELGLKLAAINFNGNGQTSKGYALIQPAELANTLPPTIAPYKGYELVTFEPIYAMNNKRWLVTVNGRGFCVNTPKQAIKELRNIKLDPDRINNIFSDHKPFLN